ncbi:dTDP-4-dehydrorhamnose 3,5-epimerase [Pseudomonas sp. HK3]
MMFNRLPLKDAFLIEPKAFEDDRGYFFEPFNLERFKEALGKNISFIQDNESKSNTGVLRGLHFQKGDATQAKLVRVIKGRVFDVIVDLRRESPTFGQHYAVELSEENKLQLFVPRGFAHGFLVLEDHTIFSYKVDNHYDPKSEVSVAYNDSELNIEWPEIEGGFLLSEKDMDALAFKDIEYF